MFWNTEKPQNGENFRYANREKWIASLWTQLCWHNPTSWRGFNWRQCIVRLRRSTFSMCVREMCIAIAVTVAVAAATTTIYQSHSSNRTDGTKSEWPNWNHYVDSILIYSNRRIRYQCKQIVYLSIDFDIDFSSRAPNTFAATLSISHTHKTHRFQSNVFHLHAGTIFSHLHNHRVEYLIHFIGHRFPIDFHKK